AHFRYRAVAIVGHALDQHRDAAWCIALVGQLLDIVRVIGSGATRYRAIDGVARHVGSERLVDGGAQAGVVIRLGPAQARGDGQLANQLGEDLAFLRILTGFAMFDVRPLGMTSHKNRLICAWITLILRCKVTRLTKISKWHPGTLP